MKRKFDDQISATKDDLDNDDNDKLERLLQNCERISSNLCDELYGSSLPSNPNDRFAEVDFSSFSTPIVSQDVIDAARGATSSEFKPVLKPYQLVGVNFLMKLNRNKINRAILADEMGLGKRVQASTYLCLLKHLENNSGPHLVICPASSLENWERELNKWCPSFSVLIYHGPGRSAVANIISTWVKAGLPPPFSVVLVSDYLLERFSAQQKYDREILKSSRWSCMLIDGAHGLKDKKSFRWKNLMSVTKKANQCFMLTGTLRQNDLHELWAMLNFVLPDLFVKDNVDLKKLRNADEIELNARIKGILRSFILRRLKSEVMYQLAPKEQQLQYVYMEKVQDDLYESMIKEYRAISLSAQTAKRNKAKSNNVLQVVPRHQITNFYAAFLKIANHPLLVRKIYNDADVAHLAKILYSKGVFGHKFTLDKVTEELKGYSDVCIHQLLYNHGVIDGKRILLEKQVLASAKCQLLAKLLPSLKQDGHRVLIFSQWLSMLDILEWALDVIGLTYIRLDGRTPVSERQTLVDTFNKDTSIFVCLQSTRIRWRGLYLMGADTIIIHDSDSNPYVEQQAEDRCRCVEQTKPVTVYRLVTKNTVDMDVIYRAEQKLVSDAAELESGAVVAKGKRAFTDPGKIRQYNKKIHVPQEVYSRVTRSAAKSAAASLHHGGKRCQEAADSDFLPQQCTTIVPAQSKELMLVSDTAALESGAELGKGKKAPTDPDSGMPRYKRKKHMPQEAYSRVTRSGARRAAACLHHGGVINQEAIDSKVVTQNCTTMVQKESEELVPEKTDDDTVPSNGGDGRSITAIEHSLLQMLKDAPYSHVHGVKEKANAIYAEIKMLGGDPTNLEPVVDDYANDVATYLLLEAKAARRSLDSQLVEDLTKREFNLQSVKVSLIVAQQDLESCRNELEVITKKKGASLGEFSVKQSRLKQQFQEKYNAVVKAKAVVESSQQQLDKLKSILQETQSEVENVEKLRKKLEMRKQELLCRLKS